MDRALRNTGLVLLLVTGCPPFVMAKEPLTLFLDSLSLPGKSRQVILVTTNHDKDATGSLLRLERKRGAPWEAITQPHPVTVGRSGLAWGEGLHVVPEGVSVKKEGDGKAPAGIFKLGPAFGYGPKRLQDSQWPYRQAGEHDFFIDDPDSKDYNRWVTSKLRAPESRWASFERMKREDHLYRHGLVVEHNSDPPAPGRGSAIFLHIWRGAGQPTAGCTAMAEENLMDLLRWLRPLHHPLLVQISQSQRSALRLKED